jgi:hypothetical protein
MWRIRTHRLGIDQGSKVLFSDFENDGKMWAGEGTREHREVVRFSNPFLSAPMVQIGMSMWDAHQGANQRMDIAAENVTVDGFEIVFRTWGDSKIARVRADWMALGEVQHEEDWDLSE